MSDITPAPDSKEYKLIKVVGKKQYPRGTTQRRSTTKKPTSTGLPPAPVPGKVKETTLTQGQSELLQRFASGGVKPSNAEELQEIVKSTFAKWDSDLGRFKLPNDIGFKVTPKEYLQAVIDLSPNVIERENRTNFINDAYAKLEKGKVKLTPEAKFATIVGQLNERIYGLRNSEWFTYKNNADRSVSREVRFDPNFDLSSGNLVEAVTFSRENQLKRIASQENLAALEEDKAKGYVYGPGSEAAVDLSTLSESEQYKQFEAGMSGAEPDYRAMGGETWGNRALYDAMFSTSVLGDNTPYQSSRVRQFTTEVKPFKNIADLTHKELGISKERKAQLDLMFDKVFNLAEESKAAFKTIGSIDTRKILKGNPEEVQKLSTAVYDAIVNQQEIKYHTMRFQEEARKKSRLKANAFNAYYSFEFFNPETEARGVAEINKIRFISTTDHIKNLQQTIFNSLVDNSQKSLTFSKSNNRSFIVKRYPKIMMALMNNVFNMANKSLAPDREIITSALDDVIKTNATEFSKTLNMRYEEALRLRNFNQSVPLSEVADWMFDHIPAGYEAGDVLARKKQIDDGEIDYESYDPGEGDRFVNELNNEDANFQERPIMLQEDYDALSDEEKMSFHDEQGRIIESGNMEELGSIIRSEPAALDALEKRGFTVTRGNQIINLFTGEIITNMSDIDKAPIQEPRLSPKVAKKMGLSFDLERDREIYKAAQDNLQTRGLSINELGELIEDGTGRIIERPDLKNVIAENRPRLVDQPDFHC